MAIERDSIEFDVVFVGGGPANLSGAIHLMQLADKKGIDIEVALIEKGAEIGSHQISGAVLDPTALRELIPDFLAEGFPMEAPVRGDDFRYLTADKSWHIPFTPRYLHNHGNYIISQAKFSRWLGQKAEAFGVNIFPGFAGTQVIFTDDGQTVKGVRTDDKGLGQDGKPKSNFEPGIDLLAKVTVFGEGARGSLMKSIAAKLGVGRDQMAQVYESGIKEVIQLPEGQFFKTSRNNVIHLMGYPLGLDTPGGGFLYEMNDDRVAIGYLVGMGYENPLQDLYRTFIRFKQHPYVAGIIEGGKVIEQGARTVTTGGYYSIPHLAVDGAVFVGAAAGFHNTPALKGIHVSMKSGMLAAEAIIDALEQGKTDGEHLGRYKELFETSWVKDEMYESRNFAAALARKGLAKIFHLGTQYISKGRGLVDPMPLRPDHQTLDYIDAKADTVQTEALTLKYDGSLYVDQLTGVYLSKTAHREDEPCHLIIHDPKLCVESCYPRYRCPCTRFCPGKVYEIEMAGEGSIPRLKLNPSNCLHCKTCDIKDPFENITWICPEGGEGPNYSIV